MQINNLGGARMPVTTSANSTSQTARTSFGTLVQGSAGAPTAGRASISGSSVVSAAISVNSGSLPGATFGAPYLQAAPAPTGTQVARGLAPQAQAPQAQAPSTAAAGTAEQKAMKELAQLSFMSFVSGTFAMGQSRPGIEALED